MDHQEFKITTYKDNERPEEIIEEVGKLAIDIYETPTHFIILAPIAGSSKNDIEIMLVEDVLTIKGERKLEEKVEEENYLSQECFWGKFTRSIILPKLANTKKIEALFKENVLKIKIEKDKETGPKHINIS